jgi:hypothetical protein
LTQDGNTLVYFENPLSTSDGLLIPGPQDTSRRLMKFNLREAIMVAKKAATKDGLDIAEEVVGQVTDPVTMHDGTTFYGIYPKFPLPANCFSSDQVFYVTILQAGARRIAAIDINTKQVNRNIT